MQTIELSESEIKELLFQILFAYSYIIYKFGIFRHNNFTIDSFLIQKINQNDYVLDLALEDMHFQLKNIKYICKMFNYRKSIIGNFCNNVKCVIDDPSYDIYTMMKSFYNFTEDIDNKNLILVRTAISNIISPAFIEKPLMSEELFLSSYIESILPSQLLSKNNFFVEFINMPKYRITKGGGLKHNSDSVKFNSDKKFLAQPRNIKNHKSYKSYREYGEGEDSETTTDDEIDEEHADDSETTDDEDVNEEASSTSDDEKLSDSDKPGYVKNKLKKVAKETSESIKDSYKTESVNNEQLDEIDGDVNDTDDIEEDDDDKEMLKKDIDNDDYEAFDEEGEEQKRVKELKKEIKNLKKQLKEKKKNKNHYGFSNGGEEFGFDNQMTSMNLTDMNEYGTGGNGEHLFMGKEIPITAEQAMAIQNDPAQINQIIAQQQNPKAPIKPVAEKTTINGIGNALGYSDFDVKGKLSLIPSSMQNLMGPNAPAQAQQVNVASANDPLQQHLNLAGGEFMDWNKINTMGGSYSNKVVGGDADNFFLQKRKYKLNR